MLPLGGGDGGRSLPSGKEKSVEPCDDATYVVAPVFGFGESVAFVGIDNQLGLDTQRLERVPEIVGLRGGNLFIPLALKNQRGRAHVLDEVDGRAASIRRWIVINRCAEVRQHPLI